MPEVPPPDALASIETILTPAERASRHRFWTNFDERPIAWVPWAERRAGAPCWREWYRYRPRAVFEDPFVDAARMLLLIDTMVWPAACRAYDPPALTHIAPSLDVTAHFHRLAPEADWLLCDATAPIATDGLVGGAANVWSAEGRLLASGTTHLLCRPAPRP